MRMILSIRSVRREQATNASASVATMPGKQRRTQAWVRNSIGPKLATGYIKKHVLSRRLMELFPQVESKDEFDVKHPGGVS